MPTTATYRSISLSTPGAYASGLDDIFQSIRILVSTRKFSVPFQPLMGCDIFDYLDMPIPLAVPNMTRAILEVLELFEPRITVTSLTHEINNVTGKIDFTLTFDVVNSELAAVFTFSTGELTQVITGVGPTPFVFISTEDGELLETEDGNLLIL